jgi:hypothetical protein
LCLTSTWLNTGVMSIVVLQFVTTSSCWHEMTMLPAGIA